MKILILCLLISNLLASTDKIQNGEDALANAYPYMVGILVDTPKEIRRCGGVLVSDSLVLTAYHCLFYEGKMYPATVVAGAVDITVDEHEQQRQKVTTASYQRLGSYDDVGIIKIEKPFLLNEFVHVVKLKKDWKPDVGKKADIVGWGQTAKDEWPDNLQAATLEVLDKVEDKHYCEHVEIADDHICLSNKVEEQGSCGGDSGGPVIVVDENGEDKVVGIIVRGPEECDTTSAPYADVLLSSLICKFLHEILLDENICV